MIHPELLQLSSIATPHIAGFSADGKANATRMCLEHIEEFYGRCLPGIQQISLPPPADAIINLNKFEQYRIEHALLQTFDPVSVDRQLRKYPEKFEWLRAHYAHPREYKAYSILNGTPEENCKSKELGFSVL